MKWPRLSDIMVFRPTPEESTSDSAREFSGLEMGTPKPSDPAREAEDRRWRRIRFDNAIRLWVAIPTFLTCGALWAGGAIESLLPITGVVTAYAAIIYVAFTLYFNIGFSRRADFVLSILDLISMTLAVYLTGATASPLYFIYFVPVVIHAFHRDWHLVIFSGFGGVVLYGIAVLVSLHDLSPASVADLCARLVFMLLTVAIACLALSILQKDEDESQRRIARLRAAAALGHRLNSATSIQEVMSSCAELAPVIAGAVANGASQVRLLFHSLAADDVAETEGHRAMSEKRGRLIPITTEGDWPFGFIRVRVAHRAKLDDRDAKFLAFLGRSIALCLRRQKMIDELGRSVELGTAVAAVYLARERSESAGLTAVLEGAAGLCHADQATLFLPNASDERLQAVAWCGDGPNTERDLRVRSGEGIVGECFLRGQPRKTEEVEDDPVYRGRKTGITSLLAIPLEQVDGTVAGVLTLARFEQGKVFSPEDALLASAFALRAAHALKSAGRKIGNAPPISPRLAA